MRDRACPPLVGCRRIGRGTLVEIEDAAGQLKALFFVPAATSGPIQELAVVVWGV
jgi:hypothetical protein